MKNIINQISSIRKNPILVLYLKEINYLELFDLQEKLLNKSFKKLDVILHTFGGYIEVAFQIIKLLRNRAKEVNIIVPIFAKSAGTLICIGGDKIILTELSELGPLDTQIKEEEGGQTHYNSALNGFKALEQIQKHNIETLDIVTKLIVQRSSTKVTEAFNLASEFTGCTSGTLYTQLNPMKIAEYAKALEIGLKYGNLVLARYMHWPVEKASRVIDILVKGYPTHDFIIDLETLIDLGLPGESIDGSIEDPIRELRKKLMELDKYYIELFELQQKSKVSNSKSKIIGSKNEKGTK